MWKPTELFLIHGLGIHNNGKVRIGELGDPYSWIKLNCCGDIVTEWCKNPNIFFFGTFGAQKSPKRF